MKKFSDWVMKKDIKQKGMAKKIGISTSTMHEILRCDKIPNIKTAYEIEKYTKGEITLYDWVDQNINEIKAKNNAKIPSIPKKHT